MLYSLKSDAGGCSVDRFVLRTRYLFGHSNYLASYLVASGIVRVASNWLGEPTRLTLQGLPVTAPQRVPQSAAVAAAQRLQQAAPIRRKKSAGAKKRKPKSSAARGFEMSAAVAGA